jgi:quercetin dioxygenase-like cupin family protein
MVRTITVDLTPADPRTFAGAAYTTMLAGAAEPENVRLYYVSFDPGARTHWHQHSGPQILVVIRGRCRYQREGEPVGEAEAGASIRFDPGVRHWHGAAPDGPMDHVAINLENRETTWLEAVTDAEYAGTASQPSSQPSSAEGP